MIYKAFRYVNVFLLCGVMFIFFPTAGFSSSYKIDIANLQYAGDTDKAVELAREYRKAMLEKYGENHSNTLSSGYILGQALFMDGQYEEAIKVLSMSLTAYEKKEGSDHPGLEPYIISLSALYYTVSRFEDGDRIAQKAKNLKRQ